MGIGEDFETFCSNLAVTNRSSISDRYERSACGFLQIEDWRHLLMFSLL